LLVRNGVYIVICNNGYIGSVAMVECWNMMKDDWIRELDEGK
jgi:hypothetical protein